jgi:hypothetical protein
VSRKNTLRLIAGLLLAEGGAALLLPGHMPRAARIPTAGTAVVAAVALWTIARQMGSGRQK